MKTAPKFDAVATEFPPPIAEDEDLDDLDLGPKPPDSGFVALESLLFPEGLKDRNDTLTWLILKVISFLFGKPGYIVEFRKDDSGDFLPSAVGFVDETPALPMSIDRDSNTLTMQSGSADFYESAMRTAVETLSRHRDATLTSLVDAQGISGSPSPSMKLAVANLERAREDAARPNSPHPKP